MQSKQSVQLMKERVSSRQFQHEIDRKGINLPLTNWKIAANKTRSKRLDLTDVPYYHWGTQNGAFASILLPESGRQEDGNMKFRKNANTCVTCKVQQFLAWFFKPG